MLNIEETTEATLAAVTNRVEKHGDDDVPAVSLQISIEAANTLLDQIDPNIRHALYKAVEGQDQLPGVEPATPVLRCNSFDQITLTQAHEGWTLEIDSSIDEDAPMTFGGCKVDKLRVDAKQGGSIVLRMRIGTSDVDADRLGALAMHNGQSIWVRLKPPEKRADAIDGTVGHPGAAAAAASGQGDLLDSNAAGDAFSAAQGEGQPGPEDEPGEDDGSGHTDTDGAPGAGSSDEQMGKDWPFPRDGTEAGSGDVGGVPAGADARQGVEQKPRGRRGRNAAAQVG